MKKYCPSCNTAYKGNINYCIKCGSCLLERNEAFKEKFKRKHHGKSMLVFGIILAILLVGGICIQGQGDSVGKVEKLLEEGDWDSAKTVYAESIQGDDKAEKKAETVLTELLDQTKTDYINQILDYSTAMDILEAIKEMNPEILHYDEVRAYIEGLKQSRDAYNSGELMLESGLYVEAIRCLEQVCEEDANYANAQKKIETAKEDYRTNALKEAEGYRNEGKYLDAIYVLQDVLVVLGPDSEINKLLDEYALVKDTKIIMSKSNVELVIDDNIALEVTFEPENVTDRTLVWESSDSSVVRVEQSGMIYAVGEGEAVITAISEAGNIAKCDVTVTGRFYTAENLPEGIFIKEGDFFYPLSLGMPAGYYAEGDNYYWTEADNYDSSDFPVLKNGTIIAYKGPIQDRNIAHFAVDELFLYGYVLDVLGGGSITHGRDLYDFSKNPVCDAVAYIDDVKGSMYTLLKEMGWVSAQTFADLELIFGDFEKDEKHRFGYFEGTEYREVEATANMWGASLCQNVGYSQWDEQYDFEQTRNGYFEATLEVPESGLYVLNFYGPGYWSVYRELQTLIWVEK